MIVHSSMMSFCAGCLPESMSSRVWPALWPIWNSGRATVDSPAAITVKDGKIYATIVWSSPYYDYMIVEDETCYNEAEAGENSTFTIPIEKLPCEISVIADTTAMSVPHEIEYTILLDSASIANAGKKPMEVIAVVYVAAVIAVSITAWQIHRKRKGKKE